MVRSWGRRCGQRVDLKFEVIPAVGIICGGVRVWGLGSCNTSSVRIWFWDVPLWVDCRYRAGWNYEPPRIREASREIRGASSLKKRASAESFRRHTHVHSCWRILAASFRLISVARETPGLVRLLLCCGADGAQTLVSFRSFGMACCGPASLTAYGGIFQTRLSIFTITSRT